jgi:hypothetical protein
MKCPHCGMAIEESKLNHRQKALKKEHKERLDIAKEEFRKKLGQEARRKEIGNAAS